MTRLHEPTGEIFQSSVQGGHAAVAASRKQARKINKFGTSWSLLIALSAITPTKFWFVQSAPLLRSLRHVFEIGYSVNRQMAPPLIFRRVRHLAVNEETTIRKRNGNPDRVFYLAVITLFDFQQ